MLPPVEPLDALAEPTSSAHQGSAGGGQRGTHGAGGRTHSSAISAASSMSRRRSSRMAPAKRKYSRTRELFGSATSNPSRSAGAASTAYGLGTTGSGPKRGTDRSSRTARDRSRYRRP